MTSAAHIVVAGKGTPAPCRGGVDGAASLSLRLPLYMLVIIDRALSTQCHLKYNHRNRDVWADKKKKRPPAMAISVDSSLKDVPSEEYGRLIDAFLEKDEKAWLIFSAHILRTLQSRFGGWRNPKDFEGW